MTTNELATLKAGDWVWLINHYNHGEERKIEKISPTGRFTLSCGRVFNSDGTQRGNYLDPLKMYHPESKKVVNLKAQHLKTLLLREVKKRLDGSSPNVTVNQLERILVILREESSE